MKVIFFFLAATLFTSVPALASLQLVARETFQGVGTRTSGAPGNLGAVSGTFYNRGVGPKVSGDTTAGGLGWSADNHNASPYHDWTVAAGLGSGYNRMICGWYYLGNVASNGVSDNSMRLLWAGDSQNTNECSIEISNCSTLGVTPVAGIFKGCYYTPPSATVSITPGWYFFAIAAVYTPATYDTVTWRAYYMPQGGTGLIQLGTSFTNTLGGQATGGAFYGGFYSSTAALTIQGRYGCASEYLISSFDDVAVPPDLVAPPTGGTNWYVNPSTGNDNNDGLAATSDGSGHGPWQTDTKIDTESLYTGMFPVTTGYGTGDTLNIDCSTAPLVIGVNSLSINTSGLAIKQHGTVGATDPRTGNLGCDPMTTIAKDWTLVPGSTHTYQTTDGGSTDLTAVVIFENDNDGNGLKYLNHPLGTTLSGTVQTALDATPGSFWTDGTTLYLHPLTNTNPATDSNLYRRTRSRTDYASAITINAPGIWWDGLVIAGTVLADSATGDSLGAYCFQWNTGNGVNAGANLLSNFSVDKYSKHGVGRTSWGSNSTMTRLNGIYGQSSPYFAGGCTSDVDYSGDPTSANNQGIYINCTETNNIGLIGSSTGTINPAISSYVSHASSVAFSNVSFTNCTWQGSLSEQADIAQVNLSQTTCAQCTVNLNLTCDASKVTTYGGMCTNGSNSQLILRNCIFAPTNVTPNAAWNMVPKTALIEGCTFDLTAASGAGNKAVFARTSAGTNLTIRNCLVLGSSVDTRAMITGFSAADSITMDHNAYSTSVDKVSLAYNGSSPTGDKTLAQWQTLGFDANSFNTTQPLLASYIPQSGSPLVNAGANLDPPLSTDYSGTVLGARKTIGAYEPLFPYIVTQPVAQTAIVGQPAAFSVVSSLITGVTYQWQFQNNPIVGQTGPTLTLNNVAPGQAGNYSVVVTNAAGTVTSSTAALTVQSLQTFSQWESQPGFFTSTDPSIIGPTAAPEGDSIPNLLKYLYNINPAQPMAAPDRAALPVFSIAGNGHLTFTFREYSLATGITINMQTSPDLQNWTTLTQSGTLTSTTFTMTPTGTLDPITNDPYMEIDVTPTGEPKQFIRLNITVP